MSPVLPVLFVFASVVVALSCWWVAHRRFEPRESAPGECIACGARSEADAGACVRCGYASIGPGTPRDRARSIPLGEQILLLADDVIEDEVLGLDGLTGLAVSGAVWLTRAANDADDH